MLRSTIRTFVLFLVILISHPSAFSAPKAHDFNIKVKFDRTFYSLTYDARAFTYKEGPNVFSIPIKECNKALVNKITNRYESLLSEYTNQKKQFPTTFDVKLIGVGGNTLQITRGSMFGTWLRELPKKIMYHKAEAQVICKR